MATLTTLVARNRARFDSTFGLLSGRASRILKIRIRRWLVRDRRGRILFRVQSLRCTRAALLIVFYAKSARRASHAHRVHSSIATRAQRLSHRAHMHS